MNEQRTDQSTTNQSKELTSVSTNEWTNGPLHGQMDGWLDRWMDEWTNELKKSPKENILLVRLINFTRQIFIWHFSTNFKTCLFIQCSTSCGSGTRKRSVECIAVKTGSVSTQCTPANKPNTHEECHNKKCPSEITGKILIFTALSLRTD